MKPREKATRPTPRHTLTIALPAPDPARLSQFARREIRDLCRLHDLRPGCLMRVLVECALDAFVEEPGWIEELVDAARLVATGSPVPGCWLQEDDGDTEPSDPEENCWVKRRPPRP